MCCRHTRDTVFYKVFSKTYLVVADLKACGFWVDDNDLWDSAKPSPALAKGLREPLLGRAPADAATRTSPHPLSFI
jgi:hypothetical protein